MGRGLEVKKDGKFCYPIWIEDSFEDLPQRLKEAEERRGKPFGKICIVTDSNVEKLYLSAIKEVLSASGDFADVEGFVFPAGEEHKQISETEKLYQHLIEKHFDRTSLLIALGGGVVGDMTGFAAATFLRGISFVQIPTTLLSQVDSSIGGKTAVDFLSYKNMIGSFHMPVLVYMNLSVLSSLPKEQLCSGMGEVIKHGLIRNREYFSWLLQKEKEVLSLDPETMEELVFESCKVKRAVVEEDPTEQGIRGILNFGHTLGHAIEKLSGFRLLHGQCVAIGCVCAAYGSMKRGLISEEDYEKVRDAMKRFRLPLSAAGYGLTPEQVVKTTKSDKKMQGKSIKFILLDGIGNAIIDPTVSDEELLTMAEQVL